MKRFLFWFGGLAVCAVALAATTPFKTYVTGLSAGSTLGGTEKIPMVQSTNDLYTTPAALNTYIGKNFLIPDFTAGANWTFQSLSTDNLLISTTRTTPSATGGLTLQINNDSLDSLHGNTQFVIGTTGDISFNYGGSGSFDVLAASVPNGGGTWASAGTFGYLNDQGLEIDIGITGSAYTSAYKTGLAAGPGASLYSDYQFCIAVGSTTCREHFYTTGGVNFGQATGGDPGAGKINAVGYQVNGTPLATVATSASASDLSAGTLAAARMPALTGDCTTSAGAVATTCTKTSGAAFVASATTDTTNASNISSGTLGAARLPNPTASTLGGIESIAAVTHNFLTSISTSGVPAQAQPSAADISGLATSATVSPEVTLSFYSGVEGSVGHAGYGFTKIINASTVDNMTVSAGLYTCTVAPTITFYECGTSTTCASPTTIATATVSSTITTAVAATVSNPAIAAGDYVAWAVNSGTCTNLAVSGTAQMHAN